MANIKQQKKRVITDEKRRQRNVAVRSRVKTLTKTANAAIEAPQNEDTADAVRTAIAAIDRAVTKGVMHRNAAARKKSSLMRRANAAQAQS